MLTLEGIGNLGSRTKGCLCFIFVAVFVWVDEGQENEVFPLDLFRFEMKTGCPGGSP